jgi:glycosyltransferase involved in cell wall biosynthesis
MLNKTGNISNTPSAPLVSIAMCTYNGERFLQPQLDSLLEQDYPHLEIIISDDASTDSTRTILQEYAKKHAQIQLILNEQNAGLTRNFERAISKCSGDFIALCDQDDIWFSNKISTLVHQIGKASLIYTPVQMIDEDGGTIDQDFFKRRKIQPIHGKCNKALVFDNCILGHTTLFKRELVKSILPFPDGIPAHDQWISFVAATNGEIQFYDQVLSVYRMHQDNAALKNREQKNSRKGMLSRKLRRLKTIRKNYQKQQSFLDLLAAHKLLSADDQRLFIEIAETYRRFYHVRYNHKQGILIKKEGDAFLAISQDQPKALKKICRGYLAGIFR